MTLLRGILDSKGRRAVWERNNERAGPKEPERLPPRPEDTHTARPGPDGTIYCCSGRYSPAAHKSHLAGEHLATSCGGVLVADLSDPWLSEADARLKAERADAGPDDAAILRAEQVDLYYQQKRRTGARRVSGTSDWMAD